MDRDRARERTERELMALGVSPKHWRGQNFLLDTSVVDQAVRAAELNRGSNVLEIGPGLGILTAALVATGARVIAVELERKFAQALTTRFRNHKNLTVIAASVFDLNLTEHFRNREYLVVANLPYAITGIALRNFLTLPPMPQRLVLLLQREVAERITASPGQLSILGVMIQSRSTVRILREVPPESFWPEPKVHSALVQIDPFPEIFEERWGVAEPIFMHTVRIGFSGRRKQIVNTLSAGTGLPVTKIREVLASVGIETTRRAQELSLLEWSQLSQKLNEFSFDRNEGK